MRQKANPVTRRKFLKTGALAAGAATAGTMAMPQVSRAQTVTLKMQGSWGAKDVFNEMAEDYVKRVNEMAGGRLKIDYLIGGAVVHPFQVFDGVHGGQLDGAHTVTVYWYGKHKAASLFGTGPVFGFNANEGLGWIHNGGGRELFDELQTQIMKVNIVSFFAMPMPTQPLGWFKKPVDERGRHQGPEVPHRRPCGRSVPGHGRVGRAASGRRDRAGHGARRDRRLRVQQPDLGPPLRRPGRGQELHDGQPPPGDRVLRDHVQQGPSSTRCPRSTRRSCSTPPRPSPPPTSGRAWTTTRRTCRS